MYYVWHILFNSLRFLPFLVSMARGYVDKLKKNLLKCNLKELNFEEGFSLLNTKFYCNENTQ